MGSVEKSNQCVCTWYVRTVVKREDIVYTERSLIQTDNQMLKESPSPRGPSDVIVIGPLPPTPKKQGINSFILKQALEVPMEL